MEYDLNALLEREIQELNQDTAEDRRVKEAVIVAKPDPNRLRSEYDDNDDYESDNSADYRGRNYFHDGDDFEEDLAIRDPELFKTTELNRQIHVEGAMDEIEPSSKERPPGLVFSDITDVVTETDQITATFYYGAQEQAPKKRRKYLMTCDFGDESLHAMHWAISTMLRSGDEIHIASVINTEESINDLSLEDQNKLWRELDRNSKQLISEVKSIVRKMLLYDIKIVLHSIAGRTRESLLDMICSIPLTMVICGSRGRSGFRGMLMGSVSTYLVHNSPVPVSVVRPQNKAKKKKKKLTAAQRLSQSMYNGQLKVDEADSSHHFSGINHHDAE